MEYPVTVIHKLSIFILLCSCRPTDTSWEVCEARTKHTSHQAFKISQKPANIYRGMEIQFVRTSSGLHSYLNIFSLKFTPSKSSKNKTKIILRSEEEEVSFLAFRLQGDQRLLIPDEAQNYLIEKLSEQKPVTIIAGRFDVDITPADFSSHLPKLRSEK